MSRRVEDCESHINQEGLGVCSVLLSSELACRVETDLEDDDDPACPVRSFDLSLCLWASCLKAAVWFDRQGLAAKGLAI